MQNVVVMPAPKKGTTQHVKLTQDRVRRIPLAAAGKAIAYLDTELKGFMVIAAKTAKSYYVQRDIRGRTVKVLIGRTNLMDAKDARAKATELLAQMMNGVNPNDQRRAEEQALVRAEAQGMTLREAVDLHLGRKKERSPQTLADYQRIFRTYLTDWMDKPIRLLAENPHEIEQLHDRISRQGWDTESIKGRGRKKRKPAPYSANGMVRALRAVYNYARGKRRDLELPEFPMIELNPEKPSEEMVPLELLPAWYNAVMATSDPIRRDAALFIMFTGLRKKSALSLLREHVNLENRCVFIPQPKGGERRAFYLPLSDFLVDLVKRRLECPVAADLFPGTLHLFPGERRKHTELGFLDDVTFNNDEFLKQFSSKDYRHSYQSYALAAGLLPTDVKFLVNHKMANQDITFRYAKALLDPLREQQQKVTDFILEQINKPDKQEKVSQKI